MVNILIESGADLKNINLIEQTLLHKAAANGMIELMNILFENRIKLDDTDVYGQTALHLAARQGQREAVAFLILKRADINVKNPMGKTALHLAQENSQKDIADLLIENGADSSIWSFPSLSSHYLNQPLPNNQSQIFAPGIISTEENHDYAISFHPNGQELLLSTRIYGEENYLINMKFENNHWSAPEAPSFASDFPEGEPIFSPDGQYIYFQSRRPAPGSIESNYDAWIVDNSKSDSEPQLLPEPFKDPKFLMYMSSTLDDKIYFTSMGGIYSAEKSETGYEEAVYLSAAVNGPTRGVHPFIAPDESYLIFDAKDRQNGLGESDLYICFKMKDGTWSKAQNLGNNINSSANEICASISGDGKFLFFHSNRNGNGDIYWVDTSFIEELKNNAFTKNNELFKQQNQMLGKTRTFSINHGDLNGNGYQDIFIANYFSPSRLWFNMGDNTFKMMQGNIPTLAQNEHGAAIADIDNDSDLDILLVTTEAGQGMVYLNDGKGRFSASKNTIGTKGIGYGHVYLKDADNDGDVDAFLLLYRQSNELWLNDGRGNFSKSDQVFGDEKSGDMGVEDLDGDNDIDIFLTVEDGPNEIWLNDGKGNFENNFQKLGTQEGYEKIALADLDKDGDTDAVIGNMTGGITIWLNDGKANFTLKGAPFSYGINITVGDIDNDGDIDFYAGHHRGKTDLIWLNDGNANFTKTYFFDESSIRSHFLDVDNDGDLDIVVGKGLKGGNVIYINQTVN